MSAQNQLPQVLVNSVQFVCMITDILAFHVWTNKPILRVCLSPWGSQGVRPPSVRTQVSRLRVGLPKSREKLRSSLALPADSQEVPISVACSDSWVTWVWILVQPPVNCVTLAKLLNSSCLFLHLKYVGNSSVSGLLQGFCDFIHVKHLKQRM